MSGIMRLSAIGSTPASTLMDRDVCGGGESSNRRSLAVNKLITKH